MLSQAPVHVSRTRPLPIPTGVRSKHDPIGSAELAGVTMPFGRNSEIYGEGEPAEYLYQVVTGAVRTYKILADGRRQIGAFYLPEDIFGFESGEEHHFSAEAVTDSTIRTIKRSAVDALARQDAALANSLWELTARELDRAQDHTLLLIRNAQERVACFLLEMAARREAPETLQLPMSRHDIADYLGLTIETVSRTLTQLEATGIIALSTSRRILLRNRKALNNLNA